MATITSSDVQALAGISKDEGRLALAKLLAWPPFDEEQVMQRSIHLDYLYDSWTYAVEKGFSWHKVAFVVSFADQIINQIKECDKITDILGFFNANAPEMFEFLGDRDYRIFSSFIFETILPHFKLYQLVFTTPREEQTPVVKVNVSPPFDANSLKDTKPLKIWEYEQKVAELEKKEQERTNDRLAAKEQKLSALDTDTKKVLKSAVEVDKPLDKESIGNIIEEVMKQMTLSATENIKFNIERFQDDLEFKLEKTSLPRPQALGPPPRYSTQPMKIPSGKSPRSPKPSSRASQRGKKK